MGVKVFLLLLGFLLGVVYVDGRLWLLHEQQNVGLLDASVTFVLAMLIIGAYLSEKYDV